MKKNHYLTEGEVAELCAEDKELMLRKSTKIMFSCMCELTGEMLKNVQGIIVGHAKEIKKMWPEEFEEIVDPVYLVKRKDSYGGLSLHVVYPEEVIEDKFKQVRIMQAYKAKVRAEKEKKRREYYFK